MQPKLFLPCGCWSCPSPAPDSVLWWISVHVCCGLRYAQHIHLLYVYFNFFVCLSFQLLKLTFCYFLFYVLLLCFLTHKLMLSKVKIINDVKLITFSFSPWFPLFSKGVKSYCDHLWKQFCLIHKIPLSFNAVPSFCDRITQVL